MLESPLWPPIEFIQGIPDKLDSDAFIDPRKNNIIVLDDLMSTATKDPRITELFTEGSHHRNLSVLAINQNLYYSKDPTQRRNCQYLVLFNNPIDKQATMTLARQMYPGNTEKLLRVFNNAVSKPYGYLLVDLKVDTPEEFRLKPNGLAIKGAADINQAHLQFGPRPEPLIMYNGHPQPQPVWQYNGQLPIVQPQQMPYTTPPATMMQNGQPPPYTMTQQSIPQPVSHLCRPKYATWSDDDDDDDDTPVRKRRKVMDLEERGFRDLVHAVLVKHDDDFKEKVCKYLDEGCSEKKSRIESLEMLRPRYRRSLRDAYEKLLCQIHQLQFSPCHSAVTECIQMCLDRGDDHKTAIKCALRLNASKLDEVLDVYDSKEYASDDEDKSREESDMETETNSRDKSDTETD